MQRWVMHVDMDAFFASVEQRDNIQLAGRPVVVGGIGSRGVVAAASYEARVCGVRSAMPMAEARRRCLEGVFLPADHARYSKVSADIMAILADFSPLVEPLSLDEAFLDVSGMEFLYPDLRVLAVDIKQRIQQEVGLIASVGIAENKFLAKLASEFQKPDGLTFVSPDNVQAFLKTMPVKNIWGVGAATYRILAGLGIHTIGQLAKFDVDVLTKHCGSQASLLHALACGQDSRMVIPNRPPLSVGKEQTFAVDLTSRDEMTIHLLTLAEQVGWRLRRLAYSGRTITVKIRYQSFKTITRSVTLEHATNFDALIYQVACDVFDKCIHKEGVRLLGITVSNLQQGGSQSTLFDDISKQQALYGVIDKLKQRFGETVITKAKLMRKQDESDGF